MHEESPRKNRFLTHAETDEVMKEFCYRVNREFNLAWLNRLTAQALRKMRAGDPPLLDPAFEPEVIEALYKNGCPVLPEDL